MKRWLPLGIIIFLFAVAVLLGRTAIDPENFTGEWYSTSEQTIYLFQEGLIYCTKYPIGTSGEGSISGAYSFTSDSIVLFAAGVDGLASVRELYLVENREESLLCENKDGSGHIYFVRYNQK